MSEPPPARRLIDHERYPLEPTSDGDRDRRAAVIERAAVDLRTRGVAILPGFLRPDALTAMADEALNLRSRGHYSVVAGTPYIGLPDPDAPPGHPRAHVGRTALTAIAYDVFDRSGPTRSLYEWDPLMDFVGEVIGVDRLYRYADPLGALNVAVMDEGDELGWHFDQTDFVVSIAVQSSFAGGDFVHVPRIRDAHDERYDDVAAVLQNPDHERIEQVPMVQGTLMLFQGRNSLHRVTPVVGALARLVALLAYDTAPDTNSSDLLKLVRYGRVA